MATNYGQPPHFDLSGPFFEPLARIEYGSSTGSKRLKMAIRRYTYKYIDDNFIFFKTYKGVRQNANRITSVNDTYNLNLRKLDAAETIEPSPSFITQNLLTSIFDYPSSKGLFFIEGVIQKRHSGSKPEFEWTAPNWFDIYRYGKIINNEIIVLKERSDLITRNG